MLTSETDEITQPANIFISTDEWQDKLIWRKTKLKQQIKNKYYLQLKYIYF